MHTFFKKINPMLLHVIVWVYVSNVCDFALENNCRGTSHSFHYDGRDYSEPSVSFFRNDESPFDKFDHMLSRIKIESNKKSASWNFFVLEESGSKDFNKTDIEITSHYESFTGDIVRSNSVALLGYNAFLFETDIKTHNLACWQKGSSALNLVLVDSGPNFQIAAASENFVCVSSNNKDKIFCFNEMCQRTNFIAEAGQNIVNLFGGTRDGSIIVSTDNGLSYRISETSDFQNYFQTSGKEILPITIEITTDDGKVQVGTSTISVISAVASNTSWLLFGRSHIAYKDVDVVVVCPPQWNGGNETCSHAFNIETTFTHAAVSGGWIVNKDDETIIFVSSDVESDTNFRACSAKNGMDEIYLQNLKTSYAVPFAIDSSSKNVWNFEFLNSSSECHYESIATYDYLGEFTTSTSIVLLTDMEDGIKETELHFEEDDQTISKKTHEFSVPFREESIKKFSLEYNNITADSTYYPNCKTDDDHENCQYLQALEHKNCITCDGGSCDLNTTSLECISYNWTEFSCKSQVSSLGCTMSNFKSVECKDDGNNEYYCDLGNGCHLIEDASGSNCEELIFVTNSTEDECVDDSNSSTYCLINPPKVLHYNVVPQKDEVVVCIKPRLKDGYYTILMNQIELLTVNNSDITETFPAQNDEHEMELIYRLDGNPEITVFNDITNVWFVLTEGSSDSLFDSVLDFADSRYDPSDNISFHPRHLRKDCEKDIDVCGKSGESCTVDLDCCSLDCSESNICESVTSTLTSTTTTITSTTRTSRTPGTVISTTVTTTSSTKLKKTKRNRRIAYGILFAVALIGVIITSVIPEREKY